jgi:hypothetical protein
MIEENVELVRNLCALGDFLNLNPDTIDPSATTATSSSSSSAKKRGANGVSSPSFLGAGDRVGVFTPLVGKGWGEWGAVRLEATHVWTITPSSRAMFACCTCLRDGHVLNR